MKLNYYARLNDKGICTEILSTKRDMKGVKDYISIPDYNETLLYRKWDGEQWSSERYEPEIETLLQEKLDSLEKENKNLQEKYSESLEQIEQLKSSNNINLVALMEVNARLRGLEEGNKND